MAKRIYTKTGDTGSTSLLGGAKVSKADARIEAYGSIDELNAHVGLCIELVKPDQPEAADVLLNVQQCLFIIGSCLACAETIDSRQYLFAHIEPSDICMLEKEIDRMSGIMPELKHFILPGGHVTVAQLHIARCVCRRAERNCVRIISERCEHTIIIQYLNRLSDYLFILARFTTYRLNIPEISWTSKKVSL